MDKRCDQYRFGHRYTCSSPSSIQQFNNADQVTWLSVAFAPCPSALVLPWSRFYGLYNAKYLYIRSLCLFIAGSALCGAAPTMSAMIVGRALAGMGGSEMYFGILVLLSVSTTVRERQTYTVLGHKFAL
ncbi:hypothetical protein F5884DRAFT_132322 [Xylogone sp. PMI_703]|nr:hypothetical protein F5884DRAFT_132322 [Xylogone sp. PMI_703]